jgi:hypothetical protein
MKKHGAASARKLRLFAIRLNQLPQIDVAGLDYRVTVVTQR